jgi:hypothetical protein
MSNLTRYSFESAEACQCNAWMEESPTGEYVKFDDIKEFLKPTANNGSVCASQIAAVVNYMEQQSKAMVSARSILNHIYGTLRQLHTCR